MFSGIVQALGRVAEATPVTGGARFRIEAPGFAGRLQPGDSVAVNGVCVTVTAADDAAFGHDAVTTTLERTTLGSWRVGSPVNLERALRLGEAVDGHLVQGHVDGTGEVTRVERGGETACLGIRVDPAVSAVTVDRGSLAIDGVSLTVAAIRGDVAEFSIIPYTWTHTTLGVLEVGSRVNVEADLIGKYVSRLLSLYRGGDERVGDPERRAPSRDHGQA